MWWAVTQRTFKNHITVKIEGWALASEWVLPGTIRYQLKDKHIHYTDEFKLQQAHTHKHTHTPTHKQHIHTHTYANIHAHTGINLANTEWQNELGSKMTITLHNRGTGVFEGKYQSVVGNAEKWYIMVGRTHTTGKTVGWTVVFENEYRRDVDSTCTWSGQFQADESENPVIRTTWLLTRHKPDLETWESTIVGCNNFTKIHPRAAGE